MKNTLLIGIFLILNFSSVGQIPGGYYFAKEFSKEITLYKAKSFLIERILDSSNKVVRFSIDPLAATKSGELTSVSYQCEEQHKEGLILGFYSDNWNHAGILYKGYAFKDLPRGKAKFILNKIETLIKEHSKYIDADDDNNNIYFYYDDMTFLIYKDFTTKIRVYWNDFDSEWEMTAFKRTKKRLLKNLD